MKKEVYIFIDRDGTLIYDNKFYLGRTEDWKSYIRFLPGISEAIKFLRKIPHSKIYMITNQTGVAIKDFPKLNKARANEVCKHILDLLATKGAKLDGYFLCFHASPAYKKKHPEFSFDNKKVCNCDCIKPHKGMILKALAKEKLKIGEEKIYTIGDRASDVLTGIKAKGFGILVPFKNEPDEPKKFKKIKSRKKHLSQNLEEAAHFILKKEKIKY
jgi:HAD superfamily hydrolase (TIGR01662 family)